jgi:Zn finger protein HypA/HybF involved in hydrogenase expression
MRKNITVTVYERIYVKLYEAYFNCTACTSPLRISNSLEYYYCSHCDGDVKDKRHKSIRGLVSMMEVKRGKSSVGRQVFW